jgi:hypothetical protein
MAVNKKKPFKAQRAEGPAVETPLHVWCRPATDDGGRPVTGRIACTKWTPLEAYFHNGRLTGGNPEYSAEARFSAGQNYSKLWDRAQPNGRDSTQALNVVRSSGSGGFTESQVAAMGELGKIEANLSARDKIIIRMVCGQAYFPTEAVTLVSPDYVKSAAARFREALDSLVEASASLKR